MQPPERVLIFLLSGLGDALMFTPALRLMRLVWEESRLVVLTMRPGEYDALLYNTDLDEVRLWPFLREHFLSNLQFVAEVRKQKFDLSVLPCPSNRMHYNAISFVCGAKKRAAFRYLRQSRQNLDFLNTTLLPHRDHIHNVEHNIRLVESLTDTSRQSMSTWTGEMMLPTTDQDREEAAHFLKSEKLINTRCVGLHLSSSRAKRMERKCWPKEQFLEFIEQLGRRHPDVGFIVFCGEEDTFESEWLAARGGGRVRIARKLPIRTVTEIIRTCALFVTNDSGLLHVACTIRTPTVVVFGPTNPRRTGPWLGVAEVVRTGIPCSPCFYHTSQELTCPAGLDFACLRELPVARVVEAAERFLAAPRI